MDLQGFKLELSEMKMQVSRIPDGVPKERTRPRLTVK